MSSIQDQLDNVLRARDDVNVVWDWLLQQADCDAVKTAIALCEKEHDRLEILYLEIDKLL